MESADGGLVQLNVSIWSSILTPERYFRLARARLPNEADFLTDLAPLDDFETAGEKLKRPIHWPLRAAHRLLDCSRSLGR